jgi:hypothetical protein
VQPAQSLNDLGVLRRERGNAVVAASLLEEALAMRRKLSSWIIRAGRARGLDYS